MPHTLFELSEMSREQLVSIASQYDIKVPKKMEMEEIAFSILDAEAKDAIPENIRLASNRQLPVYSQLAKVEIQAEPFEKTPKMSIRRFLYK